MSVLDLAELEHAAELVAREAQLLLMYAQIEHDKLAEARARGDAPAEHAIRHRIARIARQLTRAQAGLVFSDDERHTAAKAVIGYCDEADERERPWGDPIPPVRLGAVA